MNNIYSYKIHARATNFKQTDFLKHYGVSGQKWGVRRFQNPDGSLTPEGRERYGKSKKDKTEGNEPSLNGPKERRKKVSDEELKSWLIVLDGPLSKDNVEDHYRNLIELNNAGRLGDFDVSSSEVSAHKRQADKVIKEDPSIISDNKKLAEAWKAVENDPYGKTNAFSQYLQLSNDAGNREMWAVYNYTMKNYPKDKAEQLLARWYENMLESQYD